MDQLPASPPAWITRSLTILFRPRLALSLDGDQPYKDFSSVVIYRDQVAEALYLRGWLENFGVETARECSVFAERIELDGKKFDDERSPLAWTHEQGDATYAPRMVRRGRKRAVQFDICKIDGKHTEFQILSKKSERGFHTFAVSGFFTLDLAGEGAFGASIGRMSLDIEYDHEKPDFRVADVRIRSRFRVW